MIQSKTLWAFLSGLAVGGFGIGLVVSRHSERNFAEWYILGVADQANVAGEILAGRGHDLALANVERFPEYIRAMGPLPVDPSAKNATLWRIRDAYQASGVAPPKEVEPLLRDLPPRSACKLPARTTP